MLKEDEENKKMSPEELDAYNASFAVATSQTQP